MSSRFESNNRLVPVIRFAVITIVCSVSILAAAQDQPAPKWELFGGYSFLYPGANLHGMLPGGLESISSPLESNPRGAGVSLTYNFNHVFGLTLDSSTHWGSGESTLARRIDDAAFSNLSFGPKVVTFRSTHFSPFLEALVGDHRLMPDSFHDVDKLGFMVGGGLDVNATRHVALRLIRADYVMSGYRYGSPANTASTDLKGVRLQAGLVFMWGGERTVISPSAACTIQPTQVFVGEPVTATAEGSNFNPKHDLKYNWTGSGVNPGRAGASTQIDSTGLEPGPHQVTASLSDGSPHGVATCSATFTVTAPRPPSISCASDPASARVGETVKITSKASSPDGRRLTYSYATSAGTIAGSDNTATLDSRGAQPGTLTVTCNVSDDRKLPLTAFSSTTVNLQAPPPPTQPPDVAAIEKRLALHSVYFATAQPRLEHPDTGLLASPGKNPRV